MSSKIETVAVMAPGDMGHAVATVLAANGLRVITCLTGRSERTRALAAKAGIEAVADDRTLVETADLLLSILPPDQAPWLATRIAEALRAARTELLLVDCNAISPGTSRLIGDVIEAAGGTYVDAGIIGPPPKVGAGATRIYASGAAAEAFARLADHGLDIRPIGPEVGAASAVKMCYAALTKGTTAIMTELAVAAARLGVGEVLRAELELSQGAMLERMQQSVPAMVPKAHRWVGEMLEIARTFEAAGLTPKIFEGAAEFYAQVATDPLGQIAQEDWNRERLDHDQVIARLAATRR